MIETVESPVRTESNPRKVTKTVDKQYTFADLAGQWGVFEIRSGGVGVTNYKNGVCLIPLAANNILYSTLRGYVQQSGTSCYFDGDGVTVTNIVHDGKADLAMLFFERRGEE
jgi:hypothetical protein